MNKLPNFIAYQCRVLAHRGRSLQRVLQLAWASHPQLSLAAVGVGAISGLIPWANMYVRSALLALLAHALRSGLPESHLLHDELITLLILFSGLLVVGEFLQFVSSGVQSMLQARVNAHTQALIASKAGTLDLEQIESLDVQDRIHALTTEGKGRRIAASIINGMSSATTIILLSGTLLIWQGWLLPVILIPQLAIIWLKARLTPESGDLRSDRMETARRTSYFRGLLTGPRAAREVRLLGLTDFFVTQLRNVAAEAAARNAQRWRRELAIRGTIVAVLSLSQPLLLGYLGWMMLHGQLPFLRFSFYLQAITSLQNRLQSLLSTFDQFAEGDSYVDALDEFLRLKPHFEVRRIGNLPIWKSKEGVTIRGVYFKYPKTSEYVLRDLTMDLRPGEVTALIGENGSGKSTLVNLLGRLYPPEMGEVVIHGVNVRDAEPAEVRQRLAIMLQDPQVYNLSVAENIGLGDIRYIQDRPRIVTAAETVGIMPLIQRLPGGLDAVLGRSVRNGVELSSGQRQLIALARAELRAAPILIVDEPTSALDPRHESRFFEELLRTRRSERHVTLFICHRLAFTRTADRILVLEGGRIIEDGCHDALIARSGRYAELFQLRHRLQHVQH